MIDRIMDYAEKNRDLKRMDRQVQERLDLEAEQKELERKEIRRKKPKVMLITIGVILILYVIAVVLQNLGLLV